MAQALSWLPPFPAAYERLSQIRQLQHSLRCDVDYTWGLIDLPDSEVIMEFSWCFNIERALRDQPPATTEDIMALYEALGIGWPPRLDQLLWPPWVLERIHPCAVPVAYKSTSTSSTSPTNPGPDADAEDKTEQGDDMADWQTVDAPTARLLALRCRASHYIQMQMDANVNMTHILGRAMREMGSSDQNDFVVPNLGPSVSGYLTLEPRAMRAAVVHDLLWNFAVDHSRWAIGLRNQTMRALSLGDPPNPPKEGKGGSKKGKAKRPPPDYDFSYIPDSWMFEMFGVLTTLGYHWAADADAVKRITAGWFVSRKVIYNRAFGEAQRRERLGFTPVIDPPLMTKVGEGSLGSGGDTSKSEDASTPKDERTSTTNTGGKDAQTGSTSHEDAQTSKKQPSKTKGEDKASTSNEFTRRLRDLLSIR